jgi:hypothetical protein
MLFVGFNRVVITNKSAMFNFYFLPLFNIAGISRYLILTDRWRIRTIKLVNLVAGKGYASYGCRFLMLVLSMALSL